MGEGGRGGSSGSVCLPFPVALRLSHTKREQGERKEVILMEAQREDRSQQVGKKEKLRNTNGSVKQSKSRLERGCNDDGDRDKKGGERVKRG